MMKITLADWRLGIEWQNRDGRAWYVRPSGHWVLQSHARVRRSRCRLAKRVPPVHQEEQTTLSILLRRWQFFFFFFCYFLLFCLSKWSSSGSKCPTPKKIRWRKKVPRFSWFIDLSSLFTWWVKMGRLQTKQTTCEDMIGRRETAWKAIKHSTAQTHTRNCVCVCVCGSIGNSSLQLTNTIDQFSVRNVSHAEASGWNNFFFYFQRGEKKLPPIELSLEKLWFCNEKTLMMKQLVEHTIRDSVRRLELIFCGVHTQENLDSWVFHKKCIY